MASSDATIESSVSVSRGIPKISWNGLRTAIKRIAVKAAPTLSIKKTVFDFKVSAFIILLMCPGMEIAYGLLHLPLNIYSMPERCLL